MRNLFAGLLLLASAQFAFAEDKPKPSPNPVGIWYGVMKAGPIELRIAFQVEKDKDGKLGGKLISLDQNNTEVPFTKASADEGKLTLDIANGAIVYTGTFDEKGGIKGQLKQNGQTFDLNLVKIDKLPTAKRPQTPKKPFAYLSEDVSIENESAKIKLAGTLTLPKEEGPFPAVVLVSGSGPQDRDETLFDHKPFHVIADHLAKQGIACLRYDDRGIGKSGGQFVGATSGDFATDAYAGVKFLKADKRIDPKRIGICGHSEGGMIAPIVAAAHPDDVGFIILLAGPGVPGERIILEQAVDFSKPEDVEEAKRVVEAVLPIMKSAKTTEEAKKALKVVFDKLLEEEKDEKKRKEAEKATVVAIERFSDPWLRYFVSHDPTPTLIKLKCPVLALNGEKDVQVKAKQNLDVIEAALKKAGNKTFACIEYKGLNHLFQKCKTGAISEYGVIEETMAPEVLKQISDWIAERK